MTATRKLLWATMLLGAALRLVGLWSFPLEQDELYTVHEATALFHSRLNPGIEARPLYFLIQHALLAIHSPSPAWLRLLPYLCGVAGLWLTWRLGKAVCGEVGGLVAAFLAAMSPWHLYASGFARYYALVYALGAGAYLLLLRAYETDRPRELAVTLAVLLVGTATHPSFVFPVATAVCGLHLVTVEGKLGWRWPTRTAWIWLWGPYAVALLIAAAVLKVTGHSAAVQNWGGRGLTASLRLLPAMIQWMTPTMFVVGGLGALAMAWRGDAPQRRWGMLATTGTVGGLGLLVLASFRTNVYADYGIAALPLVFVSTGGLLAWLVSLLPATTAGPAAIVGTAALVAGVFPSTVSHLRDGTRFDYRPAYDRIAREAPQTAVLTDPIVVQRHYAPGLRSLALRPRPAYLDSVLAREQDLWAVVSVQRYGIVGDGGNRLRDWLFAHCREVNAWERPRLDYRVYRVALYRCRAERGP